ncbi:hypothetical protein ACHRV5_11950 [Flavobacterium sp. FlaQc-52]|jgi:hypothetical protein|uniref:hypothetical protein n=1 Tax=Flavobacterium sp. FlaQc-52 TaxID=3374185 RepID=UPI003757DB40
MRIFFVLMVLFCMDLTAQNTEFKVYDNGLIYSENSVGKLKHIVDSLNLKFKVCDFKKIFLSSAQTKVNFIEINKSDASEAKKDLENNISYSDFKTKYPKAAFDENLVVIKSHYTNYEHVKNVNFSSLELGERQRQTISSSQNEIDSYNNNFKGKWVFEYQEKTKYSKESLRAFYFIEEFKSKPIVDKYAKLIQYADCLIDTTAQIFYKDAKNSGVRYFDSLPNKATKFKEYVNNTLKKPSFSYEKLSLIYGYDEMAFDADSMKKNKEDIANKEVAEKEYKVYQKNLEKWESVKFTRLDSIEKADKNFDLMLNEAFIEAKINKSSDEEFEEYVGRFIGKREELELKRNRRVIGGCSMDDSPRVHALNIAMLSAETTKWEIFLRSHLNIMNDRFDRASDGSYAQGARNTYIKEIEVLDINVLDLILGISLRIENPSENHYFSNINRVGRALSESSNPTLVEMNLLNMIVDTDLDDYNRVLMYYLFDNYNYNLKDENAKKLNQSKLQVAVSKLPDYISSRIIFKN